MSLESPDKTYLESNISSFLKESIKNLETNIKENFSCWDIYYGILQSDINVAEVEGYITPNQAQYLREKYLGFSKE